MAKAKRKAKQKPKKRKCKSTLTVRAMRASLLDIEDEINDLIAALGFLPELRMMSSTMRDIIDPPRAHRLPSSSDRLGQCAVELFDRRLDTHLDSTAKAFIGRADGVIAIELAEAAELIPVAVQWRLYRLAALIRLLNADR